MKLQVDLFNCSESEIRESSSERNNHKPFKILNLSLLMSSHAVINDCKNIQVIFLQTAKTFDD